MREKERHENSKEEKWRLEIKDVPIFDGYKFGDINTTDMITSNIFDGYL